MTEPALRDDLPKLEKYELLEEIGHGGMATVYRARDVRLGREVAVKIIHRHLRENREVATRFIAEARAAAKLKHRGIVEVYDVSGEEDRERYLVVELVRGMTLRKLLEENREMPAEIGAAIVIELCDAIECAHENGIIHRDIKPENVLVGWPGSTTRTESTPPPPEEAEGERSAEPETPSIVPSSKTPRSRPDRVVLKITDFGIAKILDAQGVTSTGQVLGSPAHMAPEQIEGGDVDPRTDVFALGVVLYECLVGHLPFDGKNPAQVLRRVLEGKFERADTERPTVGGVFSEIVERALANDPKDRPATPAALGGLLRDELHACGISDPRAEIEAYFDDAEGYAAALRARLVPLLVTRAEAARKARRSSDAARLINRAHALAPDDLAILKRMSQLGSASRRPGIARKVALLAGLSVGLGGVAYGSVRLLRAPNAELTPTTSPGRPASDDAEPMRVHVNPNILRNSEVIVHASAAVKASGDPSAAARPPIPRESASAMVEVKERRVKFLIQPRGATLEVDGFPIDHARGEPFTLKLGNHTAKLTPQAGDKSCELPTGPLSFTLSAPKDGDPNAVQTVALSLTFKPAHAKLQGPPGGQAICKSFTLKAGSAVDVPMDRPLFEGSCKFLAGEGKEAKSSFVTLKAGEDNVIPWPVAP